MDRNSTVLVVAPGGDAWSAFVESLTDSHGYRVLHARSFEGTVVMAPNGTGEWNRFAADWWCR